MRDTKYNLDKVKKQIDDILSNELRGCRYSLYVHYNADNERNLFSYRIKENSIQLFVNIQTVMSFMELNDWEVKISIYFCAWYVAGYINTLAEWEQSKELNTYCAGVVFCEVVYACVSNKKIKVFVPYICEKLNQCIKNMRVLDVSCETSTLLRIKALFAQKLLQNERTIIDYIVDERLLYLKTPEVIYVGLKTPSLSVKEVVSNIRAIGNINTELSSIPRLPKRDDKNLIHNLTEIYEISQDMFWIEVLVRMVICSPSSVKHIIDKEVLNIMYKSIEQYEDHLIDNMKIYGLSKNKVITDNLTIMLKYIERGKRLLLKSGFTRKSKQTVHINY